MLCLRVRDRVVRYSRRSSVCINVVSVISERPGAIPFDVLSPLANCRSAPRACTRATSSYYSCASEAVIYGTSLSPAMVYVFDMVMGRCCRSPLPALRGLQSCGMRRPSDLLTTAPQTDPPLQLNRRRMRHQIFKLCCSYSSDCGHSPRGRAAAR